MRTSFWFSEVLDFLRCPVNRSRFAFCRRLKKITDREKCVANYFLFAASPMAENGQVPWNRTKVPLLLCQPAKHNKTAFSLPRTNIIIFCIITADKYNLIQSRNNNPFTFLSSIYQGWLGNWKIMQPGLIVRVKITHHQKQNMFSSSFSSTVTEQKRKPCSSYNISAVYW